MLSFMQIKMTNSIWQFTPHIQLIYIIIKAGFIFPLLLFTFYWQATVNVNRTDFIRQQTPRLLALYATMLTAYLAVSE